MSQLRSQLQRVASRQKQAIDTYNREVRKVNQKRQLAVSRYNQAVRRYNSEVRARRSRLLDAVRAFQSRSDSPIYERVRASAEVLHTSFIRLEASNIADQSDDFATFVDASERETTNSLAVAEELLADKPSSIEDAPQSLREPEISAELRDLSPDLDDRWRGALFALHPGNPDSSRHFCTSARDAVDRILDVSAPADVVIAAESGCELTGQGVPTRRSRVRFLLRRRGLLQPETDAFATENAENVIQLFRDFNDGTHGRPGRFVLSELTAIKRRVEDSVRFLHWVIKG